MTVTKQCGAVLVSDVGSDYVCTEPIDGHDPEYHVDATHPFSWKKDALHMTQGRVILPTRKDA